MAEPSTEVLALTVPDLGPSDLPYLLAYTPEDLCMIHRLPMIQKPEIWWVTHSRGLILLGKLADALLHHIHCTHLGTRKMEKLVRRPNFKNL